MTKRTIPAISLPVPNDGFPPPLAGSETAGELRMTVGNATKSAQVFTTSTKFGSLGSRALALARRGGGDLQTTQTHKICPAQNPANRKKWDRISSNRLSDPVFNTLKSKNPASRADQSMTNTDALLYQLPSCMMSNVAPALDIHDIPSMVGCPCQFESQPVSMRKEIL